MIVSNRLAKMLMLLVYKLSQRPNWRSYSFVEDMRAEALHQLIKRNNPVAYIPPEKQDNRPNILKFSFKYAETKGIPPNPFSYATTIVTNAFRRAVKLEGQLAEFRDDCLVEAGVAPSIRRQTEMEMGRSSEPIIPQVKPRTPRTRKSDCKTN